MTDTRIAGPLDERQAGAIHALARTLSYTHRIRAIARTAAKTEAIPVVRNRRVVAVPACGCVTGVPANPAAGRLAGQPLCPHHPST